MSEGSGIAIGAIGTCILMLLIRLLPEPSALASERRRSVEHGPTSKGFDAELKRVYLLCAMRAITRAESLEDAKEIAKAALAEGEKGL